MDHTTAELTITPRVEKKIILVYCGEDGAAGKAFASKMRVDGTNVFLCSAADFSEPDMADDVVIMPDVPAFRRKMIEAAYPDETVKSLKAETVEEVLPIRIKHRGHGVFYLMRGDKTVSGPHTKEEAKELAV